MKIFFLIAGVGFAAMASAGEQSVYKCVKGDGSVVFSPQPCGKTAQEMRVKVTPKSEPDPTSDAAPAAATPAENNAIRDISDGVADSHCRDDARKLYIEPDTSSIARAEAEIRKLQDRQWYGNTPGAAAQAQRLASDDETRIVGLRNVIATEQSRADAARAESRKRVDEALARCDDQKRVLEERRQHGG